MGGKKSLEPRGCSGGEKPGPQQNPLGEKKTRPGGQPEKSATGAAPTLYNLKGRGLTLQVNGVARCIAAAAIAQGDDLVIADAYGRVETNAVAGGSVAHIVGRALSKASAANDVVMVLLNFRDQT